MGRKGDGPAKRRGRFFVRDAAVSPGAASNACFVVEVRDEATGASLLKINPERWRSRGLPCGQKMSLIKSPRDDRMRSQEHSAEAISGEPTHNQTRPANWLIRDAAGSRKEGHCSDLSR